MKHRHRRHNAQHEARAERMFLKMYRGDAAIRQGRVCKHCREPFTLNAVTAEHRTARANGGATRAENIDAACPGCNRLKGKMTEKRFKALLRNPPADAPWGLVRAHYRWRFWRRVEQAQKRILRFVGLDLRPQPPAGPRPASS